MIGCLNSSPTDLGCTCLIGESNEDIVTINGIPCRCLLDTGSMVSTLSETFYNEYFQDLPILALEDLIEVKNAGGHNLPYLGYIEVSIGLDSKTAGVQDSIDVLVLVVPETEYNSRVPLLLGTNLLKLAYVSCKDSHGVGFIQEIVTSAPWRMTYCCLAQCDNSTFEAQVCCARTTVIPGNSKTVVSGIVNCGAIPHSMDVVSDAEDITLPGGLTVGSCLVRIVPSKDDRQVVELEVQNLSSRATTLSVNTPLCYLQVVDEVHCSSNTVVHEDEESFLQMFDLTTLQSCLNADEIHQVNKLLCKWKSVFSLGEFDLGRTNITEHSIKLTDDNPVKQRHRRIPPSMYEEVRNHLKGMLKAGIISESDSPYASPMVLVRKRDNSLRICVDYREINNRTVKDAYYLPRIDETMDAMAGSKWFSSLDLKSGFWQVEVKESDKHKTAFTAGGLGLFQHNTMPMGMTNSPATFQRLMEKCLGDLQPQQCLAYLDDLCVYSSTVSEHFERLERVFEALQKANLKLKPGKCKLFRKSVSFLGHVISEDGISTDGEKIAAVKNWPIPKCVKDVQRFLGFAGFYRRFVKDFSKVVKPIVDLLGGNCNKKSAKKKKKKTNIPWRWGEEQQVAFDKVIELLCSAPVLGFAEYKLPFILHTDASISGLGAILYQQQGDRLRVIAYASRGLSKSERNYPANKLEFLALKWSVTEKFHDYLYGHHCDVRTDNNPLTYILSTAKLDALGHRWLAALSMYDLSISYRSGKRNIDADALSRMYESVDITDVGHKTLHSSCVAAICGGLSVGSSLADILCYSEHASREEFVVEGQTPMEVLDVAGLQQQDSEIAVVIKYVNDGVQPSRKSIRHETWLVKRLLNQMNKLEVDSGVLYRKKSTDAGIVKQIVLPKSCRSEVFSHLHDDMGHQGRDRTLSLISARFYWPGMTTEVEKMISKCERCLRGKGGIPQQKAPLTSISTSEPLELVCMDFLSLEPSGGYSSVLVITDHFTRFSQAIPTRNQTAKTTAKVLYDSFIVRYGIPTRLHSDQGRNFESKVIKELCTVLGIEKSRTTPFHPESNGICERFNQSLVGMVRSLPAEKKARWFEHVRTVTQAYNCTVHPGTGYSPFFLMFGREPKLPIDIMFGLSPVQSVGSHDYCTFVQELRKMLDSAFEKAKASSDKSKQYQKARYDLKCRGISLQKGDLVLVRKKAVHWCDKLADKWEQDIYEVLSKPYRDLPVYEVRSREGGRKRTLHRNMLLPVGYPMQDSAKSKSKKGRKANPVEKSKELVTNHQSESENEDIGEEIVFPVSIGSGLGSTVSTVEQVDHDSEAGDLEVGQEQAEISTEAQSPQVGSIANEADVSLATDVGEETSPDADLEGETSSPVVEQPVPHEDSASSDSEVGSEYEEAVDTIDEPVNVALAPNLHAAAEDQVQPTNGDSGTGSEAAAQSSGKTKKASKSKPVVPTRVSSRNRRSPQRYGEWVMAHKAAKRQQEPIWEKKGKFLLSLMESNPGVASNPEMLKVFADFMKN